MMPPKLTVPLEPEPARYLVDPQGLPAEYPTHFHSAAFWEALGRTVATFGYLENVLGRAIFAITGTTELPPDPVDTKAALDSWGDTLERAVKNPLGNLINAFGKAVRQNSKSTITNIDDLLHQLREAAKLRNVICHGFWQKPDLDQYSVPLFVNNKLEIFETAVDIEFLRTLRASVVEMSCAVVSTVTHMGWRFPGSSGPGKPVWPTE